ncbi:MAG: hypothetical protein J6K21_02805 [Bacilli bacterium]|nr:hypothetical protein [Bacilli bacterium]
MNEDIIFIDDNDIIFDDIKENKISEDNNKETKIIFSNEEKEDITDIMKKEEINRTQILEEALDSISNHTSSIIELEKKAKNFNQLLNKYKRLEKEYINLNSTYMIKSEKIDYINNELKEAEKKVNDYEKKVSVLKSLLEIIIKLYGYDDICKATRLTKNQIDRFLN